MKKILVLILFILLSSCTNYSSIEINNIDEVNTLYCYKEYKNYEEYIDIEYKGDNVISLFYSYVFDMDISNKINKLNYDNINYYNKILDINFDSIKVDEYKNIKKDLMYLLNIKKDSFNYIENNNIKYSLFRDYIIDYSCE